MVILACAGLSQGAIAGQAAGDKPFSIDVPRDCRAVANVAFPWLKSRGVHIDWVHVVAPGGKTTPLEDFQVLPFAERFMIGMSTTRMRGTHGIPIFNFNGRYVRGGKWHSFLTAPHVNGMYGDMTLRTMGPNACVLSVKVVFHTLIATNQSWMTPDTLTLTEFVSTEGPDVQSNGRLEREYAWGIVKELHRHPK